MSIKWLISENGRTTRNGRRKGRIQSRSSGWTFGCVRWFFVVSDAKILVSEIWYLNRPAFLFAHAKVFHFSRWLSNCISFFYQRKMNFFAHKKLLVQSSLTLQIKYVGSRGGVNFFGITFSNVRKMHEKGKLTISLWRNFEPPQLPGWNPCKSYAGNTPINNRNTTGKRKSTPDISGVSYIRQ